MESKEEWVEKEVTKEKGAKSRIPNGINQTIAGVAIGASLFVGGALGLHESSKQTEELNTKASVEYMIKGNQWFCNNNDMLNDNAKKFISKFLPRYNEATRYNQIPVEALSNLPRNLQEQMPRDVQRVLAEYSRYVRAGQEGAREQAQGLTKYAREFDYGKDDLGK